MDKLTRIQDLGNISQVKDKDITVLKCKVQGLMKRLHHDEAYPLLHYFQGAGPSATRSKERAVTSEARRV